MKKILTNNWALIGFFLISIFSVLPFFQSGFFQIHDDVQVARVYEMGKSLSLGMFPVRWVIDLGYGFGYPIFNFYSVLPYYLGGTLTLFGFDALLATKIIFVIAIIGSGISMYYLVNSFFGKAAALTSALVYLYFPYHAVNIYVRGDLAELWAYMFLPLVFLSFFKIYQEKNLSKKYIVIGALSMAAVIICHNLSAFMLFIFLGIFSLFSLLTGTNKKNIFTSCVLVFGLAFMLSAFYAVPATIEASLTNVLTQVGGGADFAKNFVCIRQLWDGPWGFGGSVAGCVDGLSFKLGKSNIIFAVIAILLAIFYFSKLKENRVIIVFSIVFLILSVFMTLPISNFIWELPFMDFLQYPWRFLNFTGVFISIVIGSGVWIVSQQFEKKAEYVAVIVIILSTLFINGKLFVPQRYLDRSSDYYTNKMYLNWTASKISDEYLPKGFVRPTSYEQISKYKLNYNNSLYKAEPLPKPHFMMNQTLVQKVSNAISLIGVLGLITVIISKFGKKEKSSKNG